MFGTKSEVDRFVDLSAEIEVHGVLRKVETTIIKMRLCSPTGGIKGFIAEEMEIVAAITIAEIPTPFVHRAPDAGRERQVADLRLNMRVIECVAITGRFHDA